MLPHIEDIIIDKRKFYDYALNPKKDINKAEAFKSALGYDLNNAEDLIDNIMRNIAAYEAVDKGHNGYGEKYQVVLELTGFNGKTAFVLNAWIVDDETDKPRLVSAYVIDRNKVK